MLGQDLHVHVVTTERRWWAGKAGNVSFLWAKGIEKFETLKAKLRCKTSPSISTGFLWRSSFTQWFWVPTKVNISLQRPFSINFVAQSIDLFFSSLFVSYSFLKWKKKWDFWALSWEYLVLALEVLLASWWDSSCSFIQSLRKWR